MNAKVPLWFCFFPQKETELDTGETALNPRYQSSLLMQNHLYIGTLLSLLTVSTTTQPTALLSLPLYARPLHPGGKKPM